MRIADLIIKPIISRTLYVQDNRKGLSATTIVHMLDDGWIVLSLAGEEIFGIKRSYSTIAIQFCVCVCILFMQNIQYFYIGNYALSNLKILLFLFNFVFPTTQNNKMKTLLIQRDTYLKDYLVVKSINSLPLVRTRSLVYQQRLLWQLPRKSQNT